MRRPRLLFYPRPEQERLRKAARTRLLHKLQEAGTTGHRGLRNVKLSVHYRVGRMRTVRIKLDELPRLVRRLARQLGTIVLRKGQEYSRVEYYTLRELRHMGHPYSRRFGPGASGLPDWIVNLHTMGFFAGWQLTVTGENAVSTAYVQNVSRVAPFLTARGTRYMRPRPIMQAAFRHTKDERDALVSATIEQWANQE